MIKGKVPEWDRKTLHAKSPAEEPPQEATKEPPMDPQDEPQQEASASAMPNQPQEKPQQGASASAIEALVPAESAALPWAPTWKSVSSSELLEAPLTKKVKIQPPSAGRELNVKASFEMLDFMSHTIDEGIDNALDDVGVVAKPAIAYILGEKKDDGAVVSRLMYVPEQAVSCNMAFDIGDVRELERVGRNENLTIIGLLARTVLPPDRSMTNVHLHSMFYLQSQFPDAFILFYSDPGSGDHDQFEKKVYAAQLSQQGMDFIGSCKVVESHNRCPCARGSAEMSADLWTEVHPIWTKETLYTSFRTNGLVMTRYPCFGRGGGAYKNI